MKLTKSNLKQIIKEELEKILLNELQPDMVKRFYKIAISDCEGGKDALIALQKHAESNIYAKRKYEKALRKRKEMNCNN